MDNYQDYINRIYSLAVGARLVRTKGEFAAMLEVDRSGLSAAMNGNEKYQTKGLLKKVRRFAVAHGLEEGDPQPEPKAAPAQAPGFWVPEEFRKTMENMTETIKIQAQVIAGLQSRSVDALLGQSKKTFLADGD